MTTKIEVYPVTEPAGDKGPVGVSSSLVGPPNDGPSSRRTRAAPAGSRHCDGNTLTGYATDLPVRRDEPHWYRFDIDWCPVCLSERTERTRMAGQPPADPGDRYHIEEHYDYCL